MERVYLDHGVAVQRRGRIWAVDVYRRGRRVVMSLSTTDRSEAMLKGWSVVRGIEKRLLDIESDAAILECAKRLKEEEENLYLETVEETRRIRGILERAGVPDAIVGEVKRCVRRLISRGYLSQRLGSFAFWIDTPGMRESLLSLKQPLDAKSGQEDTFLDPPPRAEPRAEDDSYL